MTGKQDYDEYMSRPDLKKKSNYAEGEQTKKIVKSNG